MPKKVEKAYEISDAHIQFVSLVDKAANKKQFLITKSEDGKAEFQTFGRILKADAETHQVTGIVYEPMVEDTQGNYMTAEEIEKAEHWFMKNGSGVDLQHSFQPMDGASVVESWIAKSDEEINGSSVKAGTWLMTMEITDPDIYAAIEKGDITGFSMGGSGVYSDEDVDISDEQVAIAKKDGRGILQKFASLFGFDVIEKGEVKDDYDRRSVRDCFWTAFYVLEDVLIDRWNPDDEEYEPETDSDKIQEALQDFSDIVTDLLSKPEPASVILSADSVEKSGEAHLESIRKIHKSLGEYLEKYDEEEDINVTKSELEETVTEAVRKAMEPEESAEGEGETAEVQKSDEPITEETIQKMVQDAVEKATTPEEKPLTMDEVKKCIEETVAKAMEPVLKSTGTPTNLNGEEPVEKDEKQHYLHGIL